MLSWVGFSPGDGGIPPGAWRARTIPSTWQSGLKFLILILGLVTTATVLLIHCNLIHLVEWMKWAEEPRNYIMSRKCYLYNLLAGLRSSVLLLALVHVLRPVTSLTVIPTVAGVPAAMVHSRPTAVRTPLTLFSLRDSLLHLARQFKPEFLKGAFSLRFHLHALLLECGAELFLVPRTVFTGTFAFAAPAFVLRDRRLIKI